MKMNFTDNQIALEYAMYMMVGSYFDNTVCKNYLQEKKMRVQYVEQKKENQYLLEDICIAYVEKNLVPNLPDDFWKRNMKVRFVVNHRTNQIEIRFSDLKYILRIWGEYNGKNSKIFHQIWMKK
jgi:hypothetical protein